MIFGFASTNLHPCDEIVIIFYTTNFIMQTIWRNQRLFVLYKIIFPFENRYVRG